MTSTLALVFAAAILPAVATPPIEVLSASPRGAVKTEQAARIQIVFNKAVVPLAAPALGEAPPEWLRIDPPMLARWRWAGTAVLVGEPVSDLPGATTYEVTVARGLRAIDGSTLGADFTFGFSTERPTPAITLEPPDGVELSDYLRYWEKPTSIAGSAPILIVWNQPVDDGSVQEHVTVKVKPAPFVQAPGLLSKSEQARIERADPEAFAAWKRFVEASRGPAAHDARFTLEPDGEQPHRLFRIRPLAPWPPAAAVTVEVRPGVRSLEGPDPGAEPARISLAGPLPFAPRGVTGTKAPGGDGALDPETVSLALTSPARWQDVAPHFRWRAAGDVKWHTVAAREGEWWFTHDSLQLALSPLGLQGGRKYEVCLSEDTPAADGAILGFPWCGTFRTAHQRAKFVLVERDGVVEWDGPHVLPLSSTNVVSYRVRQERVGEDQLVARVRAGSSSEEDVAPKAPAITKTIGAAPDRRAVSPVDLDPALQGKPGIVWTRVERGEVVPGSLYGDDEWKYRPAYRSALTQVTSLGLTVKSSRHAGILAWVTRLSDGHPAPGATVRVRDEDGAVVWEGTTDADGITRSPASLGPKGPFLVTARIGEDLAYARADWNEGHRAWEFNLPLDWRDRAPMTGVVWSDRGIVRPGESVNVKAVLREEGASGLAVPARKDAVLVVRDSRGRDVEVKPVTLDEWGSAQIEIVIPEDAALGAWDVSAMPEYAAPGSERPAREAYEASGSFRVAEFRRPKFRVGVTPARTKLVAGDALDAVVEGALLAGGFPTGASTRWSVHASRAYTRPAGSRWEEYEFLPTGFFDDDETRAERDRVVAQDRGTLDGKGRLALRMPRVETLRAWPTRLEIEAEVQDVDRQTSAARAEVQVLPGAFQLGLRRPGYFVQARDGVDTRLVALLPDGGPAPAAAVRLRLVRRHWESVRRRDASGRYEFESRNVDEMIEERTLDTGADPVEIHFDLPGGGYYALSASAVDDRGNSVESATAFYVLGEGENPWRLDQANRIELVVEKQRYAPGETARLLVKSPWSETTALITVERAGVLESRVEQLRGPMPVVEIPVRQEHVPNAFVSIVLLRGRIQAAADPEMADPGRPAYRIGYAELTVPPEGRSLEVRLSAGRAEYRPGHAATAKVHVDGPDGRPRRASVTLWAVDAGVLALTGYHAPDLISGFYGRRGLGVVTGESRSRLVGRRSYGTKGDRTGGGGGILAGADQLRTDFRAVAVWRGELVTDASGDAAVEFTLPDSLTTYRLMAVAIAGTEEFGSAETEFRVSKPLGIEPALPRFLRPGDHARAGVVVRNRTKERAGVRVRASVPAGAPVRIEGPGATDVTIDAGGSAEVRFGWVALEPGDARIRFEAATLGSPPERDAMEIGLPVRATAPTETVATFFSTGASALQKVEVPADVFPETGGLEVRVAPTALVAASQATDYLLRYPHRCAEQTASRLLGVSAAARLGASFAPEQVDGLPRAQWIEQAARSLAAFQRESGGFAFWKDSIDADDVLTAHVTWALAEARRAGAGVGAETLDRASKYLSRVLRRERWPWGELDGWTAKVLASFTLQRLDRAEPGYYQALYETRVADRPVWGKAVLAMTILGAHPSDPRAAVLMQDVRNALAIEARSAALREPAPEWGWRVWWSDRRASAAALLAIAVTEPPDPSAERLARGLLESLTRDGALTPHDAAWMLQALALYREQHEAEPAVGEAIVRLGREPLLRAVFDAGPARTEQARVAMPDLRKRAGRDGAVALVAEWKGSGIAHVAALLSYASSRADRPAVAQGISLSRRFLDGAGKEVTGIAAGEHVTLEVTIASTADRRFVAIDVPIPAGLEPSDPQLATTAKRAEPVLSEEGSAEDTEGEAEAAPGFDHIEQRDDRIVLYATHLPPGSHATRIDCRATTAGRFALAPAHAEAMYAPELFATTPAATFEVLDPPRGTGAR